MRICATLYSLMAIFFTTSFCQADEEIREDVILSKHAATAQEANFDHFDDVNERRQYLEKVDEVLTLWMDRLSYLARMCDRLQAEFEWDLTHPLMRYVRDPLLQKEHLVFNLREDLRYAPPSQTKSQVEDLVDAQKIDPFMVTNVLFGDAFLSLETSASFSKQDLDIRISKWIHGLEERNKAIRLNFLRGATSCSKKDRLMLIDTLHGLWLFRDDVRYAGPKFPFPFLSESNQE